MPKRTYKDFELMTEITKQLKFEIEHCGKMKKDIAKEAGISATTLSDYLSGKALPNLIVFKKLCEAVNGSADMILNIKLQ